MIKILLVLMLLLTGCTNHEDQINQGSKEYIKTDNYQIIDTEVSNNSRYWLNDTTSKIDLLRMPYGLMEYSKDYFDVDTHYLKLGSILDYDDLMMLQRRESSDYPYALNPSAGDFKINDTQTVKDPYIVSGIYSLDFTDENGELKGLSFTVLFNQNLNIDENGSSKEYYIDDDYLKTYGYNVGFKLERFLRAKKNIAPDIPIYIMLYAKSSSGSYVPGHYFSGGYFSGRSGQFKDINENYYLLPSKEISNIDGVLAEKFTTFKKLVSSFMPENASVIGLVKYEDNSPVKLEIEVKLQAKTQGEIYVLTQYIDELLNSFYDYPMAIQVDIKQMDDSIYIINKEYNSNSSVIIDLN